MQHFISINNEPKTYLIVFDRFALVSGERDYRLARTHTHTQLLPKQLQYIVCDNEQ